MAPTYVHDYALICPSEGLNLNEETHSSFFVYFSVYGRSAGGLSGVSMFHGLTRILFRIAHNSGPPGLPTAHCPR
jgi:hypothetical protein